MSVFSSREIAMAIWITLLVVLTFSIADVRSSVLHVIRSFFKLRILVWVGFMLLYTAGIVGILYIANLWDITLLKDTFFWFCLTGFILAFSFAISRYDENIFSAVVADSFKVIIVFEFLINTYTFPLLVEIILIPVVLITTLLHEAARRNGNEMVSKVLLAVLSVVGFYVFAWSLRLAMFNISEIWSIDTARDILLAPILTVLFAPFIYLQAYLMRAR